jgi:uncharacterized protein (DUF305 family)
MQKNIVKTHCGNWISTLLISLFAISLAQAHDHHEHAQGKSDNSTESAFIQENTLAMSKMMAAMDTKPSGDVDHDFVQMMTAHHQGAIDMAMIILKFGNNEQLRRLAQEIIVDQQQEIAAMQMAVGGPLPPSVAAPTQIQAATHP